MADEFSLFTSLRYDKSLEQVKALGLDWAGWNYRQVSPLYMLDFHRDRLLRAATHWEWKAAIDAISGEEGIARLGKAVEDAVGPNQDTPLRVRIELSRNGDITVQKGDTPAMPLQNLCPKNLPQPGATPASDEAELSPQYELLIDVDATKKSEYTHFKTTKRQMYDDARARAGLGLKDLKEVVLVNEEDGAIMEGSLTTPYFWRDNQWVTPPVPRKFSTAEGSGGNDGTTRRMMLERGLATEQVVKASSLVDMEQCWISNGVRGFISCVVRVRE